MTRILISACLLGDPVRYDGKSKALQNHQLAALVAQGRVVGFCPEVAGGLPVPRPAAEIQGADGAAVIAGQARIKTASQTDVTDYFISGAKQALDLCQQHGIRIAVLTESSPSCGCKQIYDGSFTRTAFQGAGVTTALLRQNGIVVFNQHQLETAITRLDTYGKKE